MGTLFASVESVLSHFLHISLGKSKFSLLSKKTTPSLHIDKLLLEQACRVCLMYDCCLRTLTQIATDIQLGLGCNETLVCKMFYFVKGVLGLDADKILLRLSSENEGKLGCLLTFFCQITQFLLA